MSFSYKRLVEPVEITPDGQTKVVGWVGQHSFVVADYRKIQEGVDPLDQFSLDGEEVEKEAELLSLWDWAKKNSLSLEEMEALQDSLQTYIEVDEDTL